MTEYPLKPESFSFACLAESHAALRHCVAHQISSRSEEIWGRGPLVRCYSLFAYAANGSAAYSVRSAPKLLY